VIEGSSTKHPTLESTSLRRLVSYRSVVARYCWEAVAYRSPLGSAPWQSRWAARCSSSSITTRREFAVALHVCGGDFFAGERSEWEFGTSEERPRDLARTRRLFDEANDRRRNQG
jgi:hypothetical protein